MSTNPQFVRLVSLQNKLAKIGIEIEFSANIPWIYLHKVNDRVVEEKYDSDHAFTIGYLPMRNDEKFTFLNIREMFRVIRKYAEMPKIEKVCIDPPSGWRYGFPKCITQDEYEKITNLNKWITGNGYPVDEMLSYGDMFHVRIFRK